MADKPHYTAEQMIAAIRASKGMITHAAKMVGCSYTTMRRYIDNYPTVKEAYQDTRYQMADNIETTLYAIAIGKRSDDGKKWEQEPNVTALIFLAKTHPAMRERGYAERTEIANAPGETFKHEFVNAPPVPDSILDTLETDD